MRHNLLLLLLPWLASCAAETQDVNNTTPNNPNIIYILADDLGYGELGSYGQEKIETQRGYREYMYIA